MYIYIYIHVYIHICMCECMNVYIYAYFYTYTHILTCTCICMHMYVYVCVCVCVHIYKSLKLFCVFGGTRWRACSALYVYKVHLCVSAWISIYMYVHSHMYTYTHEYICPYIHISDELFCVFGGTSRRAYSASGPPWTCCCCKVCHDLLHLCHLTCSYVRNDSLMYMRWRVCTCNMTHMWHICAWKRASRVLCHTHNSHTQLVIWNSFIYMKWRVCTCNMTHSYMWHFTGHTMNESYTHMNESCHTHVTWLIHICDMTHSFVWHHVTRIHGSCHTYEWLIATNECVNVSHIHTHTTTHTHSRASGTPRTCCCCKVCHDWLYVCDITHSYEVVTTHRISLV